MTRKEFLEKLKEHAYKVAKAESIDAFAERKAAVNKIGNTYVERSNTIKDEIMEIVTENNRVSTSETPAIVFALEAVAAAMREELNKRAELVNIYNGIKSNVEVKSIIIPGDKRGEGK